MSTYLEKALLKLYENREDRFYTHIFFALQRKKFNATMGVGLADKKWTLFYNEDFNKKIIDEHGVDALVTILKHETLHLINKHVVQSMARHGGKVSKSAMMLENIAMDCAINQSLNRSHIDAIGGVTLESFKSMLKETKPDTIAAKAPWIYYHDLLMKEKQERDKNGKGDEFEKMLEDAQMDDHGGFEASVDPIDQAILEDKIRQAAERARSENAGRLPGEVEGLVGLDKNFKLPWTRLLKMFIGESTRIGKTATRSRPNRRYGQNIKGKKKDYKAKILIGIDTSGSMDGDRTSKVLSEVYGIYKTLNIELDIVECDTEIKDVFTYTGSNEFKISGRGGTNMQPAIDYAKAKKYDGLVLLTDGEFYESLQQNGVNVLFVIADNERYTPEFGKVAYV